MLWVKAFHIIFVVMWFSGLFYLPRLYVYHAMSDDQISQDRFKIMERKLYFYITTLGAILATVFGYWLVMLIPAYAHMIWLHVKLVLVLLLWIYHIYLGYILRLFKNDKNTHSHKFYRILNEFPTLILFAVVLLTVLKP